MKAPWALVAATFARPLLRRPWRPAVTAAGVALGVASVLATLLATRAAIASLREGVRELAGSTALEVTAPGGVPDSVLASLRPLAGEALILPVVEEFAPLAELGDVVRVLGVDLLMEAENRGLAARRYDREALAALLGGRAALLPAPLARELGVAPGDTIEITALSRPVRLAVAGIVTPPALAGAWDRLVLLDVAAAQEIFGRIGWLDRVELAPFAESEPGELRREAARLLPPGLSLQLPERRASRADHLVGPLAFNLTALAGISLLVGAVLMSTTLATSVVQQRYTIAVALSLGASRRQIAGAVLCEAAAIGAVGAALGVAAGLAGAQAALESARVTVATVARDVPASPVRLSATLAWGGMGLGLLVALASAAVPLREALRTPPVQGLAGETPRPLGLRAHARSAGLAGLLVAAALLLARLPARGDRPLAALLAAGTLLLVSLVTAPSAIDLLARAGSWTRLGLALPPLRLAGTALAAGRGRAAWAAGAIALATALAVAMATMIGSFRETVRDWSDQTVRADLWVRPIPTGGGVASGRLSPRAAEVAERLFGAGAVDPFHLAEAEFRGRPVAVSGGSFAVAALRSGTPFVGGEPARAVVARALARGGALVNEPFARRFGVASGDTIELAAGAGVARREVTGVFYDYSRHDGLVVLDRGDFLRLYPDRGPESLELYLPANADPEAARRALRAAMGPGWRAEVLLNREVRDEVLRVFDRTFAITGAMQRVSAAVAALAVLTVLFTLVSERARDLAVVRALGGSRAQAAGIVLGEAGLLGAAGATAGLGYGLAVGWILVKVVNLQSFGWTLRFEPPWPALAGVIVWVVPACLAAGLLPAVEAARRLPARALREE